MELIAANLVSEALSSTRLARPEWRNLNISCQRVDDTFFIVRVLGRR